MRYQLLGPLEVTSDGSRLVLGGPKQRLVLAHLLIRANQIVSADLLIDEVWGDEPPDAARPSLHSYVSHLRKALGPDRLEGRTPGYILHAADDEVDAAAFEALVGQARRRASTDPVAAARGLHQALALWHGEPLADLANELSLRPEIERLSDIRLAAQEDLFDAELSLGRHADLAPELERLVGRHPLRERLCGQLMLALYRSGRQADALAAYHRLRTSLDIELGLDPSPALETLQRQILNHDPGLDLQGEPLRGYRIVGQIASGPLAVVHRAIDAHTEREVAIKVLGRRLANDADLVRRFEADAGRVARLEHQSIVPLLDWWREPDAAYLVMRLMSGGSLADRLARGRIDSTMALRWTEQVGAALGAAHRQNVVHGDIRPANVLFDADENAYLSDFAIGADAIARTGDEASAEPIESYLAPERRAGGPPSIEADVFALGAVFAELLRSSTDVRSGSEVAAVLGGALAPAPADRPRDAAELARDVRRAVLTSATSDVSAEPTAGIPRNPFKGLRSFEEADAADFVGREELVRQLIARLTPPEPSASLVAVVGPSGSGKSSVVNAGLVPALRAGAVAGSDRWFVARMTPGHHPFEQLERALLGVAVNAPASLAELLLHADGLRPAMDRILPVGGELLLVIDQAEELFTLTDASDRRRFLDMLVQTLDDPAARVRIVMTLRADFYDRPLRHEGFGRHLAACTQAVPPMTPVELERAILEPAERAGLRPESGLAARIVAEASEQPGALPLLQYALSELWERREGTRLSLSAYDASGGIAGAVSRRAEHLVTQLDEEGREQARQIFLRLVEPGEGTPDTARKVRLGELEAMTADSVTMDEVTERFARFRLLLVDRDPDTREPTVELAHEALLRAWPRLQQWVDDARDDLRQQRRLAVAATQWIEAGRDPSFLLTGSRLAQTEAWASSTGILLGGEPRAYLTASLAERRLRETEDERRRARESALEHRALVRLRALVVVLGLGALVAGGLSVYALAAGDRAERETRNAQARELAAAALANLEIDAERSVLLALEAIDVTRSVDGSVVREAEEALHRAVVASRVVLTVHDEGSELDWTKTPDGQSIFVTQGPEESGLVTIRDATSGASLHSWRGHEADVNDIAFSSDGSMLATTGDDGLLKVWQTADRKLITEVSGEGQAWGPSFSPDGTLVAAAWPEEGIVRVLDRSSGTLRGLRAQVDVSEMTAFSPDGRQLAVAPFENAIQVFDARSLAPVGTFVAEGIGSAFYGYDFAYSPDGRWLAAGGEDAIARVWDVASGELRHSLSGHSGQLRAIAWADDSEHLVTGSSDGVAFVWEIADEGYRRLLSFASQDLPGGIAGAAFEPGGDRVLLGGNIVDAVKIWDAGLQGDAERANLSSSEAWPTISFTSDDTLVVGGSEGEIIEFDTMTGAERQTIELDADGNPLFVVKASPDGRAIAAIGDEAAWIWEADTGRAVRLPPGQLRDVAWRPDGRQFAALASDTSTVQVFDRSGGVLRASEGEADYLAIALDMNGAGVVAVAEVPVGRPDLDRHRVTLRDGATGGILRTLPAAGHAGWVAFDPSGERLAIAFLDGRVEVWDLATDRRTELAGHVGEVSVIWSHDGSRLATAGGDGTIRIWDARTGEPMLVLRGHDSAVGPVQFSPNDSTLASSGQDGTVRIWALELEELIDIAGANVTRQLTELECREYLHLDACPVTSR